MEHYFIAENNVQKGPFTLEELQEKKINKTTLVWKEGFDGWKEAGTVEELKESIIVLPPSLPPVSQKQIISAEQKTALKKSFSVFFWVFMLLGACMTYTVGGFSSGFDLTEALRKFNVYASSYESESKRWVLFLVAAYISLLPATTSFIFAYCSKFMNFRISSSIFALIVIGTVLAVALSQTFHSDSNITLSQVVFISLVLVTIILITVLVVLLLRQKNALNNSSYTKALKSSSLSLLLILALAIIFVYVSYDKDTYTWINFISSCWFGLTIGTIVSFVVLLWRQPKNILSEVVNDKAKQDNTSQQDQNQ